MMDTHRSGPGQAQEDAFGHVERESAWLRQERAAGRLTEEQLRSRLQALMFQDDNGQWWMVGQQSGEWYRNEGGTWVRASPPLRGNLGAAAYPQGTTTPGRRKTAGWGLLLVVGLVATVLTGAIPAAIIVLVLFVALKLARQL